MRKNLLGFFIAFLAITAAYAVGVSLFGEWHDTQNRVIGSCTTITVGSLFGMSCAAFGEKRRAAIWGWIGVLFCLAATVATLLMVWEFIDPSDEPSVLDVGFVALGYTTACLLGLPKLGGIGRKLQWTAVFLVAQLTLVFISMIHGVRFSDFAERVLLSEAICLGCLAVVIPILGWLARKSPQLDLRSVRVLKPLVADVTQSRLGISFRRVGDERLDLVVTDGSADVGTFEGVRSVVNHMGARIPTDLASVSTGLLASIGQKDGAEVFAIRLASGIVVEVAAARFV